MNLDDDKITTETNFIMKLLSKLDSKIEGIDKKITQINHIYTI